MEEFAVFLMAFIANLWWSFITSSDFFNKTLWFFPEPIFGVCNFSRSENFQDSDYLESMANEWTPETSFSSELLRKHKDGYPRPGLGIEYECNT